MSIFAIGDTHLSLSANKSMDVFPGWDNYVQRLEKNWKKLVKPEDTVVVVGDVSWGINYAEALADFQLLNSLPGTKVLIKGNHDYWWETAAKNQKFVEENGLDTIKFVFNNCYTCEGVAICGTRSWAFDCEDATDLVMAREVGRLKRSIDAAKDSGCEPVLFLHFPPVTANGITEQVYNTILESGIKECYYAHLHGFAIPTGFNGVRDGVRFKLVSADSIGFTPYLVRK